MAVSAILVNIPIAIDSDPASWETADEEHEGIVLLVQGSGKKTAFLLG